MIRILVVDDHEVVRAGLCRLLDGEADFKVIGQAGGGHEAVRLCRDVKPDVVLLDYGLPDLDGLEATQNILAGFDGHPAPKIIALTANVTKGIKEECLKIGMCDFMSKPLRMDKLSEVLKKYQ